MFVILLRFAANKSEAARLMEGHKAWIKRGFDDGVFLLAGNLEQGLGGGILAHGVSLPEIQSRVAQDPFVVENIVSAEVLQITPSRTSEPLAFLLS
jgi:uncharacterized protein YciI